MNTPIERQVASLAALFLYCQSVDQLARTGAVPPNRLHSAMLALLDQGPDGGLEQYRDPDHLHVGLDLLEPVLRGERDALRNEVMRYSMGILHLQRRLQGDAATRKRIYTGLERAAAQAKLFAPNHENVIASVAQCYQDTLGTYRFRIQVRGDGGYLRQPAVAARVRCLLFAAVRAAVSWRQSGGRRWQLMLRRQPLLQEALRLRRQQ